MATPKTKTAELLETYLPPRDGRQPADRLKAIAGRALADARRTHHLTTDQAEEAHAQMIEAGTRAILEYDPNRDQGTGHIPIDIRFGRFAYLRMRLRLIDWQRKHIHDPRPGRTDRRTMPLDHHDTPTTTDFADLVATEDRIQRWTNAATILGYDINAWILDTLDQTATTILDNEAT